MTYRYALVLALTLVAGSALAGKLYRWVDADGNVHYSDKVPPAAAQGERARLNERGIEVEREEAAKSPEELARDAEVKRLRAEQQRIAEQQKARDAALLKTFRTEDDIILTRNGKLAAVDAQIQLSQNNIKRLKRQLATMQANAAQLEKQGRKLSSSQQTDLQTTERQIEDTYQAILRRERDKTRLTEAYAADLKRFRELRNLADDTAAPAPKDRPAVFLETLITCADAASCEKAWEKARSYARQHATTAIQMDSDRILVTAPPRRNDDLSLTVSRVHHGDEEQAERIFLDVQCRDTALGQEFCESPAVVKIRKEFKPLLEAAMR